MSEQNFEHADNVAGRDFIQHNYSSEGRLSLGPQIWVAKNYVLGTSITSGWLAFLISLAFILLGVSQIIFAIRGLLAFAHTPAPNMLLFYARIGLIAAVGLLAGLAGQISSRGFAGIPGTQIGIARDIRRHVFVGRLGGEGSVCPLCKVKLLFHDLGPHPIVRCSHNSDHWWAFDFTIVED